jgi:hypothetical protein
MGHGYLGLSFCQCAEVDYGSLPQLIRGHLFRHLAPCTAYTVQIAKALREQLPTRIQKANH